MWSINKYVCRNPSTIDSPVTRSLRCFSKCSLNTFARLCRKSKQQDQSVRPRLQLARALKIAKKLERMKVGRKVKLYSLLTYFSFMHTLYSWDSCLWLYVLSSWWLIAQFSMCPTSSCFSTCHWLLYVGALIDPGILSLSTLGDFDFWLSLLLSLLLSETLNWMLKSGLRPKFNLPVMQDLKFRWAFHWAKTSKFQLSTSLSKIATF